MAMTMTGEVQLPAPREDVWAKLNDPEVLKACIPGCESLEMLSEQRVPGGRHQQDRAGQGALQGQGQALRPRPAERLRISGEGDGGVAGFAKGGATVALQPKDGGTLLTYNVEAQIGGKLAQLGQRLVNGAAKKMADQFFAKFAQAVGGGAAE